MKKSTKMSDSDVRARHQDEDILDELMDDLPENIEGRQISNKAGLHSTAQKLAASRPEFGPRGTKAAEQAGTGRFRCPSCGRYFDAEATLKMHEPECRIAKVATREGERELELDEKTPHAPNDSDK
jgi:hypothetical protein